MTGTPAGTPDRRLLLLGRDAAFNGLDYAQARQGRIDVHFINRVRVKGTLARDRPPVTLTVSGAAGEARLRPVDEDEDWFTDTSGRPVLRLAADLADAPARYLLTVHSDRLDPCFSSVAITVRGRDDLADCGAATQAATTPDGQAVAVDYLAKDFASFVQALSGFSAARYPLWQERSEADFGVMLMELLSALADELSYLQDRVAAEATIGTATQRLSLVRHARLVDYEPAPALAASTVVQFDVARSWTPPALIGVQALGGETGTVDFTAGWPLSAGRGPAGGTGRPLDPRWNRYDATGGCQLRPYRWDGPGVARPGATSLWIEGHGHGCYPGQELLLDTAGAGAGDPPVREIVRLTQAEERGDPVTGQPVTLIRWRDGLTGEHDLKRTEIAGNLLPAVQGKVVTEDFAIPLPEGTAPAVPVAAVRADHAGSPAHCLYTLTGPLAWQPAPAPDAGPALPRPALTLTELPGDADPAGAGATWQWVPRLLDADGTARAFTVTPERYSPAASTDNLTFYDYDGDGATIRFGDGTFGRPPAPGATFRARYLAGGGEDGNVAADTIAAVALGDPATGLVLRCTNPFAAAGGADAETHAQIRDRAPRQIGAGVLLSLTEPADYSGAALSYSPAGVGGAAWARQAAAPARWTGSWLSTLTIVDPQLDDLPAPQLAGLAELLTARRLAGTDIAAAVARYRWLDLRVTCEVRLGHQPGAVEAAVRARLDPRPRADGTTGFFGRDKWAFGQPLEASALIAAVQSCPGVAGVSRVDYRWARGPGEWRPLRATAGVAPGEILRIDNDQARPGRGLIFVTAEVPR